MLRFDDSLQDQWVNALPVLKGYGFPAAFLAITTAIQNGSLPAGITGTYESMNWQEFQQLYNQGYEIVDHSATHPDMNYLSFSQLYYQVVQSRQALAYHGITNVPAFALPYGDAFQNQTVISYIENEGFLHVYSAYGSPAMSRYTQLQSIWYPIDFADNDTSLSIFQKFANLASSSSVVGFEFHQVDSNPAWVNSSNPYSITLSQFKADMAYLKANGFTVILPMDLSGYNSVPPPPPPPTTTTTSTTSTTTTSYSSTPTSTTVSTSTPPITYSSTTLEPDTTSTSSISDSSSNSSSSSSNTTGGNFTSTASSTASLSSVSTSSSTGFINITIATGYRSDTSLATTTTTSSTTAQASSSSSSLSTGDSSSTTKTAQSTTSTAMFTSTSSSTFLTLPPSTLTAYSLAIFLVSSILVLVSRKTGKQNNQK